MGASLTGSAFHSIVMSPSNMKVNGLLPQPSTRLDFRDAPRPELSPTQKPLGERRKNDDCLPGGISSVIMDGEGHCTTSERFKASGLPLPGPYVEGSTPLRWDKRPHKQATFERIARAHEKSTQDVRDRDQHTEDLYARKLESFQQAHKRNKEYVERAEAAALASEMRDNPMLKPAARKPYPQHMVSSNKSLW